MNTYRLVTLCILVFLGIFTSKVFAQAGLDSYVKAEQLRTSRQYDQALVLYDKAIEQEPETVKYLYQKCNCYTEALRFEEGIECLKLYLEKNPSAFEVYETIGTIYDYSLNKHDKAIETYQTAYEKSDDLGMKFTYKFKIIESLFSKKQISLAGKHLEDAKKVADKLTEGAGMDDLTYLDGSYNNLMGNYDKAIEVMTSLVAKYPEVEDPAVGKYYFELGYAQHHAGLYKEAIETLKIAMVNPKFEDRIKDMSADNYYTIADIYNNIYEYQMASELLNKAVQIDPGHTKANALKAQLDTLSENGKDITKLNLQLKRETIPQRQYPIYGKLALLYYQAMNYDEALQMTNEYLAINPRNHKIIFLSAMCHYKLGASEDAESMLYSLANTPKMDIQTRLLSYFAMGVIQRSGGLYDQAKTNFRNSSKVPSLGAATRYEIRNINLKLRQSGKGGEEADE